MTDKAEFPLSPREHIPYALDVWKKIVQTQEHFNEICMKVRTLCATVVAAILSLYGVFLKEGADQIKISIFAVDSIIPISFAVFVATSLFYFVDRHWYHKLLLGAVFQGAEIEDRWGAVIPEIRMGSKISGSSPVDMSKKPVWAWLAGFVVSDGRLKSDKKLHSDAKIEMFYKPIRLLASLVLVLSLLFGGLTINGSSIASCVWNILSSLC